MTDLSKIRLLVTDVDGCLTDGRVWVDAKGYESCVYSKRDGVLLPAMREAGIAVVALTSERASRFDETIAGHITMGHGGFHSSRCEKLGIPLVQTTPDGKLAGLMAIVERRNGYEHSATGLHEVAYLGDDLPDLPCLEAVRDGGGAAFIPNDAARGVCEWASSFGVDVIPTDERDAHGRRVSRLVTTDGLPVNAHRERRAEETTAGGDGALRWVCERLLAARGYDLTTWPVRKDGGR